MKQLCNCCPSFIDGLQLPATLDTSTPSDAQNTLTTLDTRSKPSRHPRHPRHHSSTTSTRTSMVSASRQASTAASTPLSLEPRQQLDTLSTPGLDTSTPGLSEAARSTVDSLLHWRLKKNSNNTSRSHNSQQTGSDWHHKRQLKKERINKHWVLGRLKSCTWSTWSAVINPTPRAGELRSAPSWPDDRYECREPCVGVSLNPTKVTNHQSKCVYRGIAESLERKQTTLPMGVFRLFSYSTAQHYAKFPFSQ